MQPSIPGQSHHTPIIGITGGIGSGKSTVARGFGELGCVVFDADRVARAQLDDPAVREQLVAWWGRDVLDESGHVDRKAVGRIVFDEESARKKLEGLIHPRVRAARERLLDQVATDPAIPAVVLDVPLLMEIGLDERCDVIVFVDCPFSERVARVSERGWDEAELRRREKTQMPLDKKRSAAHYVVSNGSGDVSLPSQIRDVLAQLAHPPADTV